jgi:hypothetical protein
LKGCQTGQLHKVKRVIWSQKEILYTKKLYALILDTLPEDQKRFILKYVYQHILRDEKALSIYHPAHLSNAQKLRHVIRTYIDPNVL